MTTTLEQITLDGAVDTLKLSASVIKVAKDLLPPEATREMDLDTIIARNLELADKAKHLIDEGLGTSE
jgi:hypothetical protein